MEPGHRKTPGTADADRPIPKLVNACLLLISLLGLGLLVWWSVVFHPDNEQLWVVPLSLVMVGTPVIVWLSVSSTCTDQKLELPFTEPESSVVLPDPDPEK